MARFSNEYYQQLEQKMRDLFRDFTKLSDADRALIEEFLDHGEYGIAFEHLCYTLEERGVEMRRELKPRVQALAVQMEIDPRRWKDLVADDLA